MPPQDSIKTQLAIQALEQGQHDSKKVLDKVSDSLTELINMQKSHEVFHEKVNGKFDGQKAENTRLDTRVSKMETNQTWVVRLVIAAVVLKILSLLWPIG
jgi:hypothetical protein